jgi:hypothetical protein
MRLEENMEELLNIEAEVIDEPKPVKVEREGDKEDKIKDYEYT